jgi:hypothetical protein
MDRPGGVDIVVEGILPCANPHDHSRGGEQPSHTLCREGAGNLAESEQPDAQETRLLRAQSPNKSCIYQSQQCNACCP